MLAIEVANAKKTYLNKIVGIENVSFNIKYGEIFGYIGPNGAGKSTTIRALMGCLKLDSGLMNIEGHDCFTDGVNARENVGYVPSDLNFYNSMTERKYIEFIMDLKGRGYEKIDELCTYFELCILSILSRLLLTMCSASKLSFHTQPQTYPPFSIVLKASA